jgi:hypothetical protein
MAAKFETKLIVNNTPIDLNEFAHEYVTRVVICAVSMLKGGADVKSLVFDLEGNKADLVINDKVVPLSAFPKDALVCTFTGVASSLRGVHEINRLQITIQAV